ncbi:MAG: helix-turn-helix transcriptional regulator [Clostridia bacterium]|nr:helix-turn-helix transcriptional regulator [Clostridia bacterium]
MKEANITITCMNRLIKNEASAVYFDTLERICIALNCDPVDLIDWDKR